MAVATISLGACEILVDTGTSNALETLGYSNDNVRIRQQRFTHKIYGDQNGGSEGIPLDIQNLGAIHIVQFELVNFDIDVFNKCEAAAYGVTEGETGTVGQFLSNTEFRLLLKPESGVEPRNYLKAAPYQSIDWSLGVKNTQVPMAWECYPVNGVVFDRVIV